VKFPIEAGHIMTFARAVGDPNRIYYDEEYAASTEPGQVIAPPTFVRASAQFDPNYPLRPKIGESWHGSGRTPSGVVSTNGSTSGGTGLHAEQHFEYHRDVHVGDVLTLTERAGERWEREGRRGGTLAFQENITEYRNQHGDLVVTSRSVVVRTSRTVEVE
jgi:hydroxyacyl-ACP dehydratase HTD2-like protein with hotdog domain